MWSLLELIKEQAVDDSHISLLTVGIHLRQLRLTAIVSPCVCDVQKGETDQRSLFPWIIANNYKGIDEFSPVSAYFLKVKLMLDICESICTDGAPDPLRKIQDPLPL